jgi:hypothetical protein
MVSFSRIVSSVWYTSYGSSMDLLSRKGQDKVSYLDYRITKWWEDLPSALQLGKHDGHISRGMKRLRMLLYLRKCQLKILLHQPVLHSPLRIRQCPKSAEIVVQLAKDVIWKLDDLNRSTDIYATQQMCFNYFLVLSFGAILLAITQAPEKFAGTVHKEFHAALDLVQGLSLNSFVSRRLWRFIRGLRPLGDRLGATGQSHVSGVAQTGLSGEGPAADSQTQNAFELEPGLFHLADDIMYHSQPLDEPPDTNRLVEDISSIFEAMEREWHEGIA